MISQLKDTYNYRKVITLISFLAFVFGVATCFLGELFIPLASSFLAILFYHIENSFHERRRFHVCAEPYFSAVGWLCHG